MKLIQSRLTVRASVQEVWAMLSAFDQVDAWMPGISNVAYTTHEEACVGAARQLTIGPLTLLEEITTWEPESELAYTIAGLPSVVTIAHNRWNIEPVEDGTRVTITSIIEMSRGFRFLEERAKKTMKGQLDTFLSGMAYHLHQAQTRIAR